MFYTPHSSRKKNSKKTTNHSLYVDKGKQKRTTTSTVQQIFITKQHFICKKLTFEMSSAVKQTSGQIISSAYIPNSEFQLLPQTYSCQNWIFQRSKQTYREHARVLPVRNTSAIFEICEIFAGKTITHTDYVVFTIDERPAIYGWQLGFCKTQTSSMYHRWLRNCHQVIGKYSKNAIPRCHGESMNSSDCNRRSIGFFFLS